jgi:replication-associated recombination protein RarA
MDRWNNSRSLFGDDNEPEAAPLDGAPLAERMRPRSLAEFVGSSTSSARDASCANCSRAAARCPR